MSEFNPLETNNSLKLREQLEKPMPYKWRVQSFSKYNPECTCVAYVDSRQVQDRLNDVFGVMGWEADYYQVKNSLFCKITVNYGGLKVSKSDCGTESNQDALKGESSDAFKRAAVRLGVGRFLYDLDIVRIPANETKKQGNYPYPVTETNKRIYNLTDYINNLEFTAFKNMKKCATDSPFRIIAENINQMVDFYNDHNGDAIFQAQKHLREVTKTNRNPHGFISFNRFYEQKTNPQMKELLGRFSTQSDYYLTAFKEDQLKDSE